MSLSFRRVDGWIAVVVALVSTPTLAVVVRKFDLGLRRRLAGHLSLLKSPLPADSRPALEALVASEVTRLVERDTRRLNRRLDRGTVGTIIFVAAVTGVIVYLLWQLDQWWWRTLAGVIAAFGFLLIAAGGIPQLFTHEPSAMPEEAKPEDGPIRGEATR